VFATSADDDELLRIEAGGGEPAVSKLPKLGAHQLAAVGERAVVFDEDRNVVVVDGRDVPLPEPGLRLQQTSAEHEVAYVAGAAELIAVPLGGWRCPGHRVGCRGGAGPHRRRGRRTRLG
jgi:hypothetical protein